MSEYKLDMEAYFQRINYTGKTEPTEDVLKALHHAHFYSIPFENFDIQLGRSINLEPEALFKKMVEKKRGGYCFELNGLFLEALRRLGFDARPLLGRVHLTGTPSGRSHQISLVTIQGRQWIADVGFGGETPRTPIPLALDRLSSSDGHIVRLVDGKLFGTMLQGFKDQKWTNLYSFDLGHVFPADITYGNHYTSTHPASLFTSARVAALPVENGSVTLMNSTLKISVSDNIEIQELEEGQAFLDALKKYFGIRLDAPYDQLRPLSELSGR